MGVNLNSDDIFDLIEDISKDPRKTGKESLIAAHSGDTAFTQVLKAALDPLVTYGIARMPQATTHGDGHFDKNTYIVLERLKSRDLTGLNAIDVVLGQLEELTVKSGQLLGRIITKDLRAGFSASTVNKAIPDLITTFDCMLAHKYDSKRCNWPVAVEPKLDGVRVLAFVNRRANTVNFFSRSGKEFLTFDHLKKPFLEFAAAYNVFHNVVFDGEVLSGTFNETVSDVRRKDKQATDAIFSVFDTLPLGAFSDSGKGGVGDTYAKRRAGLESVFKDEAFTWSSFPIKLLPSYRANSDEEVQHYYSSAINKGKEGVVVKDLSAQYHRRRNHGWMKIKAEESVDLEIVGYEEGSGKCAGALGALIVDFNGVNVNVGSGLSDEQRKSFWSVKDTLEGRIAEVFYHEITPDGSLRHPRFKRFRDSLEHGVKE